MCFFSLIAKKSSHSPLAEGFSVAAFLENSQGTLVKVFQDLSLRFPGSQQRRSGSSATRLGQETFRQVIRDESL